MNLSEIPIYYWLIAGANIVVFWTIGIWAYPKLPDRCAIHWPLTSAEPDGFAGKGLAAFLIPLMLTFMSSTSLLWPAFLASEQVNIKGLLFSGLFYLLTVTMLLAAYSGMLAWNINRSVNMHRLMKWVMGLYFPAILGTLAILIWL